MKKSSHIATLLLPFFLVGCKSDKVRAEKSLEATDVSAQEIYEEKSVTGIPADVIMLEGELYTIESITPTDCVLYIENEYISVYSGKASRFSDVLKQEYFVGDMVPVESVPINNLESNFYLSSEVYANEQCTILFSQYPEYLDYVQDSAFLAKVDYLVEDLRFIFPISDKYIESN